MNKKTFLYFGLIPALLVPSVAAYFYFNVWGDESLGRLIYTLSKIFFLLWPLLWLKSIKKTSSIKKDSKRSHIFTGILTGLGLSIALLLLFWIFPDKTALTQNIATKANAYLDLNLKLYLFFSLFLVLGHSLFEEYYWRWFVLKGLHQYTSASKALWISSLGFSAHHFLVLSTFTNTAWAILGTFSVALGGWIWGWQYQKTKSILPIWISHACVDATIMSIGYFLLFR